VARSSRKISACSAKRLTLASSTAGEKPGDSPWNWIWAESLGAALPEEKVVVRGLTLRSDRGILGRSQEEIRHELDDQRDVTWTVPSSLGRPRMSTAACPK